MTTIKADTPQKSSHHVLLEEEWRLLNDPSGLKDGIILMSEDNSQMGKLVTWLGELPLNQSFISTLGTRIIRISDNQVRLNDGPTIKFPDFVPPTDARPVKGAVKKTNRSLASKKSAAKAGGAKTPRSKTTATSSTLDVSSQDKSVDKPHGTLVSSVTLNSSTTPVSDSPSTSTSNNSNLNSRQSTQSVNTLLNVPTTSSLIEKSSSDASPNNISNTGSVENAKNGNFASTDLIQNKGGVAEALRRAIHSFRRTDSAPVPQKPLRLLPGEKELLSLHGIEYVVSDKIIHPGSLFVTDYQILFRSTESHQIVREVSLTPLGKIYRIEKIGGKKSSYIIHALVRQVVFYCKDFHKPIVIRMAASDSGQRKQLIELVYKRAFPGGISKMFAFNYRPVWSVPTRLPVLDISENLSSDPNIGVEGWKLFDIEQEFKRIGVFEKPLSARSLAVGTATSACLMQQAQENPNADNSKYQMTSQGKHSSWRWTNVNQDYGLCKSYPSRLVVPNVITDVQLIKVATFRTQNRIPILSWMHKNGASICRCSQPKSGLVTSRSAEDELILSLIRETGDNLDVPLIIIDPRPRTNAEANRAVGAGYEKESNYSKTKVHFMGIPNIHVVRDSQQSLASLCANASTRTDSTWYSGLESTGWLKHIKSILTACTHIVKCVHQHEASCLVHCSDGWDRTSQCVSLAMLCMDPYYRTITGFCVLIDKEWIHAGHMFATRNGHASKNYSDDNRAPIFLQWVDCVWQIYRQFPSSFEFNETFLIRIADEVTNCRFGTFLVDNQSLIYENDLENKTISLWTYLHNKDNYYRFINSLYSPPLASSDAVTKSPLVLIPRTTIFALSFWSNSYLQSASIHDRTMESGIERAFELMTQMEELQARLVELEIENDTLRASLAVTAESLVSKGINPEEVVGDGDILYGENGLIDEVEETIQTLDDNLATQTLRDHNKVTRVSDPTLLSKSALLSGVNGSPSISTPVISTLQTISTSENQSDPQEILDEFRLLSTPTKTESNESQHAEQSLSPRSTSPVINVNSNLPASKTSELQLGQSLFSSSIDPESDRMSESEEAMFSKLIHDLTNVGQDHSKSHESQHQTRSNGSPLVQNSSSTNNNNRLQSIAASPHHTPVKTQPLRSVSSKHIPQVSPSLLRTSSVLSRVTSSTSLRTSTSRTLGLSTNQQLSATSITPISDNISPKREYYRGDNEEHTLTTTHLMQYIDDDYDDWYDIEGEEGKKSPRDDLPRILAPVHLGSVLIEDYTPSGNRSSTSPPESTH